MLIYEVNLIINNDIYNEYYTWLVQHIKIMLTFPGFQKAQIDTEKMANPEDNHTKLTVRYIIDTEDNLEYYLNNQAQAMREDGIKKFGDRFSATRRIFHESILFN